MSDAYCFACGAENKYPTPTEQELIITAEATALFAVVASS